jgi:hypothetical protein
MRSVKVTVVGLALLWASTATAQESPPGVQELCRQLDKMIAEHLQSLQAYPQMSARERLMGGQGHYDEGMRQLPLLIETRRHLGCGR